MEHATALGRMGLLNTNAPDLSELMGGIEREPAKAYCSSVWCAKKKIKVRKFNVADTADKCPDCRHALVWIKD